MLVLMHGVGGFIDKRELPNDVEALKELVLAQATALHAQLDKKDEQLRALQRDYDILRRMLFGPKSDRRRGMKNAPGQGFLFAMQLIEEAERNADAHQTQGEIEIAAPKPARKQGRKPRQWPQDAPTIRTTYELQEDQRVCPCGHALHEIGVDVRRELERIEMTVIHEVACKKYGCRSCGEGVVTTPGPSRVIEKGLLGRGFLSHVIVERFGNHMPYHRLEKKYAAEGLDLSRSVLQRSAARVAELLEPIWKQIKSEVLASPVVHTDDTPVTIALGSEGQSRKGRAWVYLDQGDRHWYDFTETRERDGPARVFKDYTGFIQADAYAGYDQLYLPGGATECACWAHTRRKFVDCEATDPELAAKALDRISQLYAIEREAKAQELDDVARKELRQRRAVPILTEMRAWLENVELRCLPKSMLARAVGYALNQWNALTRYTEDGRLAIDNNAAERALRPFAIGRKNWLFFQNEGGGKTAAILMSLLMTAKAIGLNPQTYFRDVLLRVEQCSDVAMLTPHGWKRHFADEVRQHRDDLARRILGA